MIYMLIMKVRRILQKLNLIRIFDNYKNTYSLILKEVCQFVFYIFYMYQMVKNIIKEKNYKCFFENATFH